MTTQAHAYKQAYLEEMALNDKSVKHARHAFSKWEAYQELNDLDLLLVKARDCQDFQTWLNTGIKTDGSPRYAKNTISGIISQISRFYDWLARQYRIPVNPFLAIDRIKVDKALPKTILTETEMEQLLCLLSDFLAPSSLATKRVLYKAHVVAELMYATGARINEVGKLTLNDVDFKRKTVLLKDSKTGQQREGFLTTYATEVLEIYVKEMRALIQTGQNPQNDSLFPSGPSIHRWLNPLLNNLCAPIKAIRFSTHHFRHAVGFHLLRSGCDVRLIQGILGHKTIAATELYTKVDKTGLRKVLDRFHPRIWQLADQPRKLEESV